MTRIALFTMFPEWPLARQTPGGALRWGDAEFALNPAAGRFDCVVVFDGLLQRTTIEGPADRTFFIAGEPPSIKHYDARFLAQFAAIVTCHSDTPHPRKLHLQQGYPWHFGVARSAAGLIATQNFDSLASAGVPVKTKLLSVIVSDKAVTAGHRHRRALVARLQRHFGPAIDVFGRGINPLPDKAEGILPYKYHVALENSEFPDYWTEKLADAFLGSAHPFYWGCSNIGRYFPAGALTAINAYDPDATIAVIERAIAEQRYEASVTLIAEARDLVLHKYNLFAALTELAEPAPAQAPVPLAIEPESVFRDSLTKKLRRRVRRMVPRRLRKKAPAL